jgi:cytidylate kinase
MSTLIIAIDGHSGCGKSSTAKKVAAILGYTYLDSGAMYRAVTLYFLKHRISLDRRDEIAHALSQIEIQFRSNESSGVQETYLNGENVEQAIRDMEVSDHVSAVSAIPLVRDAMVARQRQLAQGQGVVMDGRDIGTVVFPNADLKVFMTARSEVRAARRQKDMSEKGVELPLEEIERNLIERDEKDSSRAMSPLRRASDAIVIDTSDLKFDQQVNQVVDLAKTKMVKHTVG